MIKKKNVSLFAILTVVTVAGMYIGDGIASYLGYSEPAIGMVLGGAAGSWAGIRLCKYAGIIRKLYLRQSWYEDRGGFFGIVLGVLFGHAYHLPFLVTVLVSSVLSSIWVGLITRQFEKRFGQPGNYIQPLK